MDFERRRAVPRSIDKTRKTVQIHRYIDTGKVLSLFILTDSFSELRYYAEKWCWSSYCGLLLLGQYHGRYLALIEN